MFIKTDVSTYPIDVQNYLWPCMWDGYTVMACQLLYIFRTSMETWLLVSIDVYDVCGWENTWRPKGILCHLIIILMQSSLRALNVLKGFQVCSPVYFWVNCYHYYTVCISRVSKQNNWNCKYFVLNKFNKNFNSVSATLLHQGSRN